ncbi:hypothetical protein EV363DRAFT_1434236 [Boletus edulis]|nr:hypothetical protein EV363DRAFT_1434236 [Boletus edulis]
MITQGRGGRIIGATSVAGKSALELGRHSITVNTYAPGAVDMCIWPEDMMMAGLAKADKELGNWKLSEIDQTRWSAGRCRKPCKLPCLEGALYHWYPIHGPNDVPGGTYASSCM